MVARLGIGTVLVMGMVAPGAIAEEVFPVLEQWQFQPQSQTLVFQTNNAAQPQFFTLREPSRVVVDINGMGWEQGSIERFYGGNITRIRVAEFTAGVTRFVMETADPNGTLNGELFKLRSQPQANGMTLWQLSLGNSGNTPRNSNSVENVDVDDVETYPPALLPPMIRESVTVPPPPIPDNLRK